MSAGDRSRVTFNPEDKLTRMTVAQLQALVESKSLPARVGARYALIGAGLALVISLLAFVVALVR